MDGHGDLQSGASRRCAGYLRRAGVADVSADPDRALRALLAPGATTVVALDDDDTVVGFAHALTDGATAYLAQLLVAPEHRGRGLGRQMLAEVFQRCRVGRMDVITHTAEGFYETLPHRRFAGFRLYPGRRPARG